MTAFTRVLLPSLVLLLLLPAPRLCAAQEAPGEPPVRAGGGTEPLVGAVYFIWYREGHARNEGRQRSVLGLYGSEDPAVIRQHLEWMAGAGIDFLAVSYWGYTDERDVGRQDGIIRLLQEILPEYGMKMCIMLEGVWDDRPDAVLGKIQTEFARDPAYLTYQGKPVLLPFWRARSHVINKEDWLPWLDAYYICQDTYSWRSVQQGFGAWRFTMVYDRRHWRPMLAMQDALRQKRDYLFVAPVLPGYDSRHAENTGEKTDRAWFPRNGFQVYDRTWIVALAAHPDWIMITSWNGFPEWHGIEPSVPEADFGPQYLERTAYWIGRFKSGDY